MKNTNDKVIVKETNAKEKTKTNKQVKDENKKLEKEFGGTDMTVMLVEKNKTALKILCIGLGQAGTRLAEKASEMGGYPAIAVNTAMNDLKGSKLPNKNKLLLDISVEGTGKNISLGREAIEEGADAFIKIVNDNVEDSDIIMIFSSLGGGSGSGACATAAQLIFDHIGLPCVVVVALPMSSEDSQSHSNSINTLAKLAELASTDVISSLVVCDNSRIEMIHNNLSVANFWDVANESIIRPIHLINLLSGSENGIVNLDQMDLSSVLLGGDCVVYGMTEIDYDLLDEDDSIAEAIVMNLEGNLLASDFDLTQTRSAAVVITGSKNAMEKVSASGLEYSFAMLTRVCGDTVKVYRGVYEMGDHSDCIRVYTMLSGLGLPKKRIEELRSSAQKHEENMSNKEANRTANMSINLSKTKATSATDRLHDRIKNKNSALGKLRRNSKNLVDRRR